MSLFSRRISVLFGRIVIIMGGSEILESRNIKRPIFRKFKIANIKITKDELFDSFIFEFNFPYFRNPLNTQNIE